MNQAERTIMQHCNAELVRDLDARDIAPLLFSQGYLTEEAMEGLFEQNSSRRNICQKFLLTVVNSCPFAAFIHALRYENIYGFLAQRLKDLKSYQDTGGQKLENLKKCQSTCVKSLDLKGNQNTNDQRLEDLKRYPDASGHRLEDLKCYQDHNAQRLEESEIYPDTSAQRLGALKSNQATGVQRLEALKSYEDTGVQGLENVKSYQDIGVVRLRYLKKFKDISAETLDDLRSNQVSSIQRLDHWKSYQDIKVQRLDDLKCHEGASILYKGSVSSEVSIQTERETSNPSTAQLKESLPQSVSRIKCRDSSHTRKLATLAHKLKTLSHDGNVEKFREITGAVLKRFRNNKPQLDISVALKMKEADVAFVVLEAEASAKRVKYDVSLYGSDIFKEMESVIPFTSNPTGSSMTYLARYGSAVSMLETLDTGIAHLMYAKHHAQHIEPGKSTGMVYYIEVNLLSQKYEQNPVSELKERILKTAEEAISHFCHEDEDIKTDYQRMLMLKMVFCHLGIGLFCRLIENTSISPDDRKAAKCCLDFIERPDIWAGMEKRRKMLFLVAKSELYRQEKQYDLARCHAIEARKLALEGDWKTELSNIDISLKAIEYPGPPERDDSDENIDDIINDLLGVID